MEKLPVDFEKRMYEDLGEEAESFFTSYNKEARHSLRLNPLKMKNSKEVSEEELPFSVTKIEWCDNGFYYEEDDTPGKHPYHEAGVYYIQEASAMKPVTLLDVKPGMHVLDLCAAPGGKSTQIAGYLKGEGILITNEPMPQRAKILSENIERMGVQNALVISEMPDKLSAKLEGFFERILVDAPCSGEGMFRKHPESRDEWSIENVKICAERQQDILCEAYKMLAPGGRLVYSTCTFAPLEDEENVKWFLNQYDDMTLVSEERLWPHKIEGEGHFLAVFEKKGAGILSIPKGGYQTDISPKLKQDLKEFYSFMEETLSKDCPLKIKIKEGKLHLFGEQLFLLPKDCPNLTGLKVLRPGLHLGTIKKNRFEPSHALALSLSSKDVTASYNLQIKEATSFIEGLSLPCDPSLKGWTLMLVDQMSLGFSKAAGGMLKNHYPKGLRKLL